MIRKIKTQPFLIAKILAPVLVYVLWIGAFRMLSLTLMTYFLIVPESRLQDLSDAFSSLELPIAGISAFLFCWLWNKWNDLPLFPKDQTYFPLFPGILRGMTLALGFVFTLLVSGFYQYIGFFIQTEEALVASMIILFRFASLASLIFFEEWIFRRYLLDELSRSLWFSVAAIIVPFIYCLIKAIQFDLGTMQLITLFLVSHFLCLRTRRFGGWVYGAGFFIGMLTLFHPVMGLPVLGKEFAGLFQFKSQAIWNPFPIYLTGGAAGPLASFALQSFFAVYIAVFWFKEWRSNRTASLFEPANKTR